MTRPIRTILNGLADGLLRLADAADKMRRLQVARHCDNCGVDQWYPSDAHATDAGWGRADGVGEWCGEECRAELEGAN